MELDPLYCDVIVQRWERFSGGNTKPQFARPLARMVEFDAVHEFAGPFLSALLCDDIRTQSTQQF